MTDTATEKNTSADTDDETSEMRFGAGETAWLAVVTVLALLGVALGVIALVASDGGGGSAAPAAGGGGATGDATVSATEFAFDPADVALTAGSEVSVTLDNAGAVEHNWTVLSEEIAAESEFSEDLVLAAVDNTAAGESTSASFTLEPGEYQVICTIPGHFDAGMQGTVSAS